MSTLDRPHDVRDTDITEGWLHRHTLCVDGRYPYDWAEFGDYRNAGLFCDNCGEEPGSHRAMNMQCSGPLIESDFALPVPRPKIITRLNTVVILEPKKWRMYGKC